MKRSVVLPWLALSLAACGPNSDEELDLAEREQPLESTCTALGPMITEHTCYHANRAADKLTRTATSGVTSTTPNINTTLSLIHI